jgi:hypothetical protein
MNIGHPWPFPYAKTLQINEDFACTIFETTPYSTFFGLGNYQSKLAHIIYAYTADNICDQKAILDGLGRNVKREDKNKCNFYSFEIGGGILERYRRILSMSLS